MHLTTAQKNPSPSLHTLPTYLEVIPTIYHSVYPPHDEDIFFPELTHIRPFLHLSISKPSLDCQEDTPHSPIVLLCVSVLPMVSFIFNLAGNSCCERMCLNRVRGVDTCGHRGCFAMHISWSSPSRCET